MKNSLSLVTAILMIYLPDQLMAVSLELRQAGGKVTDNTVMVGDEFEVELWVDSRDKILSGAAVFISFDPQHFELIQNDKVWLILGHQILMIVMQKKNGIGNQIII